MHGDIEDISRYAGDYLRIARLDGTRGMQQRNDARRSAVHPLEQPSGCNAEMLREHGDVVRRQYEAGRAEAVHCLPR
jgi:hypothetical protein